MSEQQPVANEPDGQSPTATEGTGAPEPTVDELLKQFDEGTQPTPSEPTAPSIDAGRLSKVLDYVEQEAKAKAASDFQSDIQSAVKSAVGDSDLDPEYVEGIFHKRGNTDAAFQKAWLGRKDKPDAWDAVCKQLGKELQAKRSKVDANLSDDMAAVTAAVRSQSTKPADPAPSTKDMARMSDAEFEKMKRELRNG